MEKNAQMILTNEEMKGGLVYKVNDIMNSRDGKQKKKQKRKKRQWYQSVKNKYNTD